MIKNRQQFKRRCRYDLQTHLSWNLYFLDVRCNLNMGVVQMTTEICHVFFQDKEFESSWNEWWTGPNRKAKKCSMTERAWLRALKKLEWFSGGNVKKAIAVLDRSSDNGWTDLYALPEDYLRPGGCSEKMEVAL